MSVCLLNALTYIPFKESRNACFFAAVDSSNCCYECRATVSVTQGHESSLEFCSHVRLKILRLNPLNQLFEGLGCIMATFSWLQYHSSLQQKFSNAFFSLRVLHSCGVASSLKEVELQLMLKLFKSRLIK